ncbi:MAG TPA: hypothetical protein VF432_11360 [Thermoanaerobaculia bacterium]
MNTIPHVVCGVIPFHILERVAGQTTIEASANARATLEHMRELATGNAHTLLPAGGEAAPHGERRRVYDARHSFELPADFARATIDLAGEMYGRGSEIQRKVIAALAAVGLHDSVPFSSELRRPSAVHP